MSKIRIKYFGPVKAGYVEGDGFIDLDKVTVFIGSQGSGKSTITKLTSVMTWMEKSLLRGDLKANEVVRHNWFVNKYCAYQNIKHYFSDKSVISFQGKAYSFRYQKGKLEIIKQQENGYRVPKIMYVPAERNFFSAVDMPHLLKNLPSTLYTFLDEFENAKRELGRRVDLPVGDVQFEYQKNNKVASIVGPGYKIRLSEASSGYQSLIPLFLVTRYLAESIDREGDASKKGLSVAEERRIKKDIERILSDDSLSDEVKNASLKVLSARFRNSCFMNIVEEPEQNLYPTSQKNILFKLLEYVNRNEGNGLLITTHSPYIISYLTLAMKGFSVWRRFRETSTADEGLRDKLAAIVPAAACIDSGEAIVYQVYDDGSVKKLENYEGVLSDNNFLNSLLGDLNVMFDELLEIEEACR